MTHLMHPLTPLNDFPYTPAVCGAEPGWLVCWRGEGTQDECEEAARRPLCRRCLASNARLGTSASGSERDLTWVTDPEVHVEVYGEIDGPPGSSALRRLGYLAVGELMSLPEVTPAARRGGGLPGGADLGVAVRHRPGHRLAPVVSHRRGHHPPAAAWG